MTTTAIHPTIVRLGVRSVFGRRRGILLFLLPLVLIGLAVLLRVLVGEDRPPPSAPSMGSDWP